MSFDGEKLFSLLPALYRLRDAQLAQTTTQPALGPLQSLLAVIAQQIASVEDDLDQLYDDQFIETCAPWVIPYIGDLIGYQPVNGVASAVASPRAAVADTISFRRRKGTVLVLEQFARDVTGWGAWHAVEFFKLLADTQYIRIISGRTITTHPDRAAGSLRGNGIWTPTPSMRPASTRSTSAALPSREAATISRISAFSSGP